MRVLVFGCFGGVRRCGDRFSTRFFRGQVAAHFMPASRGRAQASAFRELVDCVCRRASQWHAGEMAG